MQMTMLGGRAMGTPHPPRRHGHGCVRCRVGSHTRHSATFGQSRRGSPPKRLHTKPEPPPPCINKLHAPLPAATCQHLAPPARCHRKGSALLAPYVPTPPQRPQSTRRASNTRKGTGGCWISGEEPWGDAGGCRSRRGCPVSRLIIPAECLAGCHGLTPTHSLLPGEAPPCTRAERAVAAGSCTARSQAGRQR